MSSKFLIQFHCILEICTIYLFKLFFILVLPKKVLGCTFESKRWKLRFFESLYTYIEKRRNSEKYALKSRNLKLCLSYWEAGSNFFCEKTRLRKSVPTSLSKISWYSSFDGRDVRTTIPSLTWRRLLIAPGHSVRNPENIVQEVVEGLKVQITHHCVWNTHILKVSKSQKKNWNSQFF